MPKPPPTIGRDVHACVGAKADGTLVWRPGKVVESVDPSTGGIGIRVFLAPGDWKLPKVCVYATQPADTAYVYALPYDGEQPMPASPLFAVWRWPPRV